MVSADESSSSSSSSSTSTGNTAIIVTVASLVVVVVAIVIISVVVIIVRKRRKNYQTSGQRMSISRMVTSKKKRLGKIHSEEEWLKENEDHLQFALIQAQMEATKKENQDNHQTQKETAKAEFQQRLQGILGTALKDEEENKVKKIAKVERLQGVLGTNTLTDEEEKKVKKKARMERLLLVEQGQEKTVVGNLRNTQHR